MSVLNKQEGGRHYKSTPIQPIEYVLANNLGFCEGNVLKYITRHKKKGGEEDIKKAIHYLELLLEQSYKKGQPCSKGSEDSEISSTFDYIVNI